MSTKVYGASDDLIEFEGDVRGEVGASFHRGYEAEGDLVFFSDGTLLNVKYGKADMAVWRIIVITGGKLFQRVEPCYSENAIPWSDVALFADGLEWAYVATEWERVK